MSDLFLSYSRKDSEQALALAERLRNAGINVWIDQHGIEVASSWSKEIVRAIDECKAFMLLLSSSSLISKNVTRELGLASEADKPILPVAIEDVKLTEDFRYHLSGIQRVAYTQFDAITHALASFGIASQKITGEGARPSRKALMILPFEDLSPTRDNEWFADGLVSEMIAKLSRIKALKLIDQKTSLGLKHSKLSTASIAQTLEVRYFVQGSVRKFGEQIKVDIQLLDFESGDYLWQDTHKGVFADIFEIQEIIADNVVEGLRLHLGSKEKDEVSKNPTASAEAYEFYLKASEEYNKHARPSYERAILLYREATILDPMFSLAFANLANTHLTLYRSFEHTSVQLERAEQAIEEVKRIEGESAQWCWVRSVLQRNKGDIHEAERYARLGIHNDPEHAPSYDALGYALQAQQRLPEAAEAFRGWVKRRPNMAGYFNLLIVLDEIGNKQSLEAVANEAVSLFEKHLKLDPEDTNTAVHHAQIMYWAGRREEARAKTYELLRNPAIDGKTLYNLACLLLQFMDRSTALETLQRSVERGFSAIEAFRRDPSLDPVRDSEEFQAIVAQLEARIAVQNAGQYVDVEKAAAQ